MMSEKDVEEYDFDGEGDLNYDESYNEETMDYSDEDCYTDVDSDESYEDLGEEDVGSEGTPATAFLGVSKSDSSYTAGSESDASWYGITDDDDPENPANWKEDDDSDWYGDEEDWEEEEEEDYDEDWEEEDDQDCEHWSEGDHFP